MVKRLNTDELDAINSQALGLVPRGTEFTERRTLSGFILPGGQEMIVTARNISPAVFDIWRRYLNAEVFSIQGDMVFKADDSTYKKLKAFSKGEGS